MLHHNEYRKRDAQFLPRQYANVNEPRGCASGETLFHTLHMNVALSHVCDHDSQAQIYEQMRHHSLDSYRDADLHGTCSTGVVKNEPHKVQGTALKALSSIHMRER